VVAQVLSQSGSDGIDLGVLDSVVPNVGSRRAKGAIGQRAARILKLTGQTEELVFELIRKQATYELLGGAGVWSFEPTS
jgi:hypothetical protein